MPEILLCADEHIHPHGGSLGKMDRCLEAFEWIYSTAAARGITSVISLGDLFHDREKINTFAYHRAYDILAKARERGIITYLLLGNHDMYFRESFDVNSLRPLEKVAEIVAAPKSLEVEGLQIDFLPFVSRPAAAIRESFPREQHSPILCGHIPVAGGVMNRLWGTRYRNIISPELSELGVVEGEEVEVGVFAKYKRIFLGHFHSRQILDEGRIQYVGSPLQINYSDAMDPRGVEILDTKTLKTEFVENDFSPRYFILPYDEDFTKYNLKGSHLRLVAPSDFGNADLLDMKQKILEEFGPSSVEIVATKAEKNEDMEAVLERSMAFSENREDILRQYLESTEIPEGLDKEVLLQIALEMSSTQ